MSFFPIEQAPARLNRSELAVPGSQINMFQKAADSDVDIIFFGGSILPFSSTIADSEFRIKAPNPLTTTQS